MKTKMILALMFSVLLVIPAVVGAQDMVEQQMNGSVNWTSGAIQAKGIGAPPKKYYGKPNARPLALRAAKLDALRNILEVIQGVQIDSTTTVKNYAVENDIIMSKVRGMVKGAQVVHQEYMSDGTVEITVQINLRGGFSQLVLPKEIKQILPITPVTPDIPEDTSITTDQPVQPAGEVLTGMVVDARGLGAKPAMAPKVVDETGQEVYGSAYVSREYAVQQGMSGYAKDIDAAVKNQRVTNNPVVVKGLRTEGPGKSDIVISNADAAKIRSASENLSFMKKCRVMIVVD